MKKTIVGFGNILAGVVLGGAAIGSIGNNLGNFSDATKSMIGIGVLGNTVKNTKSIFKLK